jgi:hypothetical protein
MMNVRISGDRSGFGWSDGITEVRGFGSPQAALDDYMARFGYRVLGPRPAPAAAPTAEPTAAQAARREAFQAAIAGRAVR